MSSSTKKIEWKRIMSDFDPVDGIMAVFFGCVALAVGYIHIALPIWLWCCK